MLPVVGIAAAMAGCARPESDTTVSPLAASLQEIRAGYSEDNGIFIGLDVLATHSGQAVECDDKSISVSIEVRANSDAEEDFTPIPGGAIELSCDRSDPGHYALVVDNSGSIADYLDLVKAGAMALFDEISDNEASLVRVSTEAEVIQPLTADRSALEAALDELAPTNGWTALYDGMRAGAETLSARAVQEADAARFSNAAEFCAAAPPRAVIAFTDGRENNSAGEKLMSAQYPGDGYDTTLDDLKNMRINDVSLPFYTVGLGNSVDHDGLRALATATGGRHHALADASEIPAVFETVSQYHGGTTQACAQIPSGQCGDLDVRVEYEVEVLGETVRQTKLHSIHVPCPSRANGRSATVLLTMSSAKPPQYPGLPRAMAATLAAQTVDWVSPVSNPRVLVVRDRNHHGEFAGDTEYVRTLLAEAGYDATLIDEPKKGLTESKLRYETDQGRQWYDVVWFSNPGYPMGRYKSLHALRRHLDRGFGVVLQGDDMSWGQGFQTNSITHVAHRDNGVRFCGAWTNNNLGQRYAVSFSHGFEHPIVDGLQGQTFFYGDDIDSTQPLGEGEVVLATATLEAAAGGNCQSTIPVVIAFDPQNAP